MSYHLSSLRLRSIGERSARFTDYTISTTGHTGQPQDHIVWLRNGGGKSSLLSLFYALVLPQHVDFMGRPMGRHLADYIDSGDTSHTIAVWHPAGGPQTLDGTPDRILVTGAVYEWADLRRPTNYRRNTDLLGKNFYAFFAAPGTFDPAALPVTDGQGRPTRRADYIAQLREMAAQHPGADFVPTQGLHEWERALADRRLDPEVFRAQKKMNHVEGGVEELFKFNSPKDFINFLIGLTVSPETTRDIATSIGKIADKVATKPAKLADRDFCLTAAADLETLANEHQKHKDASAAAGHAHDEALDLWQQFQAAIAAAASRQQEMAHDETLLQEEKRRTNGQRDPINDNAFLYRERAAELQVQQAEESLAEADTDLERTRRQVRVWQAADLVAEHRELVARLEDAKQRAEAEATELAPLATTHDNHAARYRTLLGALATDAKTRADEVSGNAEDLRRQAKDQAALGRKAHADALRAAQDTARFQAYLDDLTEQMRLAASSGLLPTATTDPASRQAELQQKRTRLAAKRDQIAARRSQRPERRSQLGRLLLECSNRRGELQRDRNALVAERDRHREAATVLANSPRVIALVQASDDTPVDVWADKDTLLHALDNEIRRAEADIVAVKVAQSDDSRVLAAHGDTGYLPSTLDADRICRVLSDAGVAATTGWTHLRTLVPPDQVAETRTDPAVARLGAGIVVPTALAQQARDILAAAGESTVALVTVFTAEDAEATVAAATRAATGGGEPVTHGVSGTWMEMALGMVDGAAADSEVLAITETIRDHDTRITELQQARRDDQDLRDQCIRLLTECPPGHLAALDDQIAKLEQHADEALTEITTHTAALEALERDDRADAEAEATRDREIAHVDQQLTSLAPLVERYARRSEWSADASAAERRQHEATRDAEQHAREADELSTTANQRDQAARDLSRTAQDYKAAQGRVTYLATPTSSYTAADVAADDLETLQRRVDEARRAYDIPASQHAAAAAVSFLTDQLASLSLPSDPALLASAEAVLTEPAGQSKANRAAALADAEQARSDAERHQGKVDQQTKQARDALAESRNRRAGVIRRPTPVTPVDAEHATLLAEQMEAESSRLRDVLTRIESDLVDNKEARTTLDARMETLRLLQNEIANNNVTLAADSVTPHADQPAAERLADPGTAEPFAGDTAAAEAEKNTRLGRLTSARAAVSSIEKKIGELVGALRLTALTYETVPAKARDRLRNDAPEVLAANAATLATNLFVRAEQCEADLASIAADQRIVTVALANAVSDVFDTLRRTSRLSDLPEGLGVLSGKRLLKIKFTPAHDGELHGLVDIVIEDAIAKGSKPDAGSELLKAAVHACAGVGGFAVKVLKPVHDLTPVEESIDALGRWSGGERLTAGVALYCTIAKIRAVNTGHKDRLGGMLILDNPIGRASHGPLIELQRKVAAAQGVQLLYATGVKDFDAVSHFPGVTRLDNRNGRAGTRRYIVDMDQAAEDAIFGTRVVHAERPDRIPPAVSKADD